MNRQEVFSVKDVFEVASHTQSPVNFTLPLNSFVYKLKSIFFSIAIFESLGLWQESVPEALRKDFQYELRIPVVPPGKPLVAKAIINKDTGLPFLASGKGLTIQNPGQFLFDSWYFTNEIDFQLLLINSSALKNYYVSYSIVIEVEIIGSTV